MTTSKFKAVSITSGIPGASIVLLPIESNNEIKFNMENASHNISLTTSSEGVDAFEEGAEYLITIVKL